MDARARAVCPDGSPISGFYAGGGTAVGVSGRSHKGYSSGKGLLAAAILGKVAGEAASAEVP